MRSPRKSSESRRGCRDQRAAVAQGRPAARSISAEHGERRQKLDAREPEAEEPGGGDPGQRPERPDLPEDRRGPQAQEAEEVGGLEVPGENGPGHGEPREGHAPQRPGLPDGGEHPQEEEGQGTDAPEEDLVVEGGDHAPAAEGDDEGDGGAGTVGAEAPGEQPGAPSDEAGRCQGGQGVSADRSHGDGEPGEGVEDGGDPGGDERGPEGFEGIPERQVPLSQPRHGESLDREDEAGRVPAEDHLPQEETVVEEAGGGGEAEGPRPPRARPAAGSAHRGNAACAASRMAHGPLRLSKRSLGLSRTRGTSSPARAWTIWAGMSESRQASRSQ